jgi:hypothetical protein
MVNPGNLTAGVRIESGTPIEKAVKLRLEGLRAPIEGRFECELVAPAQGNYFCRRIEGDVPLDVEVVQGENVPLPRLGQEQQSRK